METILAAPVDLTLLGLLELPADLPERLSIAEAATATGLTAHTLRYYERAGLITVARDESGYRSYDRQAMARIVFITRLRASDMPVGAISHYLDLVAAGPRTEPERLELMRAHRATILRRLHDLQAALAVTDYKIAAYTPSGADQ
ncbi:MerR family transcriptional regulator [Kribbella sp. NPDC056951]|uniref:MerR family transcriptional regulator n=1 Tax=Kribbella yunnanensis TaxID=190194 RepID=A0ABP4TPB5_9ACTN